MCRWKHFAVQHDRVPILDAGQGARNCLLAIGSDGPEPQDMHLYSAVAFIWCQFPQGLCGVVSAWPYKLFTALVIPVSRDCKAALSAAPQDVFQMMLPPYPSVRDVTQPITVP